MACYRHPARGTQITCRRCGRPICGECMIPAAVGFQCPDCVRSNTRKTRQNRGAYGGQISRNPRQTTIVIIVINAIVWGVIQIAGFAHVQYRVIQFLGLSPRGMCLSIGNAGSYYPNVTSPALCQTITDGSWVPGVADGAWWQFVTSIFTHVSIVHIGLNCLTLWFLGPPLESLIGRARFIATYLVAGLVGSLAVYWLSPENSMSYGGSGSLFGLMGALLVIFWHRKLDVRQLLMWLGLNVVITLLGQTSLLGASISWQAHLGGLVGGALIGCVWAFIPSTGERGRNQWLAIAGIVFLIVVGLVGRTIMLT